MAQIVAFDDEALAPDETRKALPEVRLWCACLVRGVQEALEARRQLEGRKKRRGSRLTLTPAELRDDVRWLVDARQRHIGSFSWICEHLGYDPDDMRKHIMANADAIRKRRAYTV